MEIIILDGTKMTTVKETHSYIAQTMRFPAYYGENLDALADCLSELGENATVFILNNSAIKANLGEYAERLLQVFSESSEGEGTFNLIIEKE